MHCAVILPNGFIRKVWIISIVKIWRMIMKFKTHAMMRSNPDFDVDAFLEPVSFNFEVTGSFFGQIGKISASVDKIPIRLAIPFLKRKQQMLTVASIGGFNVKINPMQIQIEKANVQANG